MNTYNVNDNEFKNSDLYSEYLKQFPSRGGLRIRAYAASGAVPISGLKIEVSTIFNDNKIIFFDGVTDESGLIERISLPAPTLALNNLDAPKKQTYNVLATYVPDNIEKNYPIDIYEGVTVLQNINIVPAMMVGGFFGS